MKPTALPKDYAAFLAALKQRVTAARVHVARAVNYDVVLLYWDIGRGIVEKQKHRAWGDAVVERLAKDLQWAFPAMSGFSARNVWRMKQFYLAHTSSEFLAQAARDLAGKLGNRATPVKLSQAVTEMGVRSPRATGNKKLSQAVTELPDGFQLAAEPQKLAQAVRELVARVPWGHHSNHLAKLTDPAARLYYLRAIAQLGWSRSVLLNQIKAGAYERKAEKSFYIHLAPPVPHDPRVAAPEFHGRYDAAKIPLPSAFLPLHPFDNGEMTVRDEALRISRPGVAFVDMTTTQVEALRHKDYPDLSGNGANHPNDFLHRLYAQRVLEVRAPSPGARA